MARKNDFLDKAQQVNERLDEFASKASGPDVAYGATPGYVLDDPEGKAQAAADGEGVTLYRNADGSHEAVDESNIPEVDRPNAAADDESEG
ncbi:hypothetical protein [Brevibacterium oceani]|uniref:hypothetical protein n=1 Tax=Brevibacterium oceani TaxID=358099 RepID=UPI001B32EAF2|nr:hypothetical protein [Brevibacterium oceani]